MLNVPVTEMVVLIDNTTITLGKEGVVRLAICSYGIDVHYDSKLVTTYPWHRILQVNSYVK